MVNFMFCEFFLNKSKVDTVDQVEEVKVVREPLPDSGGGVTVPPPTLAVAMTPTSALGP